MLLFIYTIYNALLHLKVFSLKVISSSGTIRGKLNFNKYNKRRNTFFKEKLVTRRFVRYIGWTSSGKNNTQCTTYLKAKNKTNEHNGERRTIHKNLTTLCNRIKINRLKTHIYYEICILLHIFGKTFQSLSFIEFFALLIDNDSKNFCLHDSYQNSIFQNSHNRSYVYI